MTTTHLGTRTTVRPIEAGLEDVVCPEDRGGCGKEVKFLARIPSRFRLRVIANVYFHGQWNRTETFHLFPCYLAAGMPYGRPDNLADDHLALMCDVLAANDGLDPVTMLDALITEAKARHTGLHLSISRRRP
jgi:hypothetical protein